MNGACRVSCFVDVDISLQAFHSSCNVTNHLFLFADHNRRKMELHPTASHPIPSRPHSDYTIEFAAIVCVVLGTGTKLVLLSALELLDMLLLVAHKDVCA